MTGFSFTYVGHWCEFCASLDPHTQVQPQIDWGARLGTDSFEAGHADGFETVFSCSDGFESIWTASKWAGGHKIVRMALPLSGCF
jgi:hypothetical protein